MLSPFDQPEFLRRAGALENHPRHLRLDIRVRASMNHEQRPRRQFADYPLQVKELAAALSADAAQSGVTHPVIETRRQQCLDQRSEEHTSELQSRFDLVCRL